MMIKRLFVFMLAIVFSFGAIGSSRSQNEKKNDLIRTIVAGYIISKVITSNKEKKEEQKEKNKPKDQIIEPYYDEDCEDEDECEEE